MRLLRAADRVVVPWRNGAGVTEEVAAGESWRISIATLDANAPFSHFEGTDRTFTLLDGGPVTLAGQGWSETLRAGDAIAFAGDEDVRATVAAPAHALNVMTVRAHAAHHVRAASPPLVLDANEIAVMLDGDLVVDGPPLAPLDAVVGPARIAGSGQLLAIRVSPHSL